MENHPIPQDVTGFQFKLIGNMTIKQFAYIMAAVILCVILYYFPIPGGLGALIKTLLIPFVGGSGLILAFVPVEGRPIDVMIGNFIRALFTPNQYLYQKTGQLATTHILSSGQSQNTTSENKKNAPIDEKEKAFLQSVTTTQQTVSTPAATQPTTIQSTTQQAVATANNLAQQEALLTKQLSEAKSGLTPQEILQASSAANQKVSALERQVNELHFQREQLEQQLFHLQKQLAEQKQPMTPAPPTAAQQPTKPQSTTTQQPAQTQAKPQTATGQKSGLPHVPDTANVIAGIVKDPRGNVLPNMLVEVKDMQGNPVRAFKTNPLGQFASATPLSPGEYTVELEDPKKQNTFDIIQLHATNQILLPIEIISHDARDELRKQLFN